MHSLMDPLFDGAFNLRGHISGTKKQLGQQQGTERRGCYSHSQH